MTRNQHQTTNQHHTTWPRSCYPALGMLLVITALFGLRADAADITFFAYSDIHYGARTSDDDDTSIVKSRMVPLINALPGEAYPAAIGGAIDTPRGVIMAGDLINDGAVASKYPTQWANFVADFGVNGEGRCKFPVFEAVGNHDVNENLFVFNQVKARNLVRQGLGLISSISANGYHYSWDWDGIHFVNVNVFPGNEWRGEADTYGRGHDPLFARDFLQEDLRENVGSSGRPVIVVQHFRPVDDNWWTYSAADKCHKVLQNYNVILIVNGHQGGGVNNLWRGINWASSNGELDVFRIAPDNTLSAASRNLTEWRGSMRKSIYLSYKSSGLPAVVNNGDWVSNVSSASATLSGKILYEAVSPTEVTLYWGTVDGRTNVNQWEHAKQIGIQKTGPAFSAKITGLQPWTDYYCRCRVANSKGEAWAAASIPFTTKGLLPAGWETAFIGYEQRPWGGANSAAGTFTVRGSGRDLGEGGQRIDNFQYAYTTIGGDGELKARIETMEGRSREPKVGVMLREILGEGSRNVALLLSARRGLRLNCRENAAGSTSVSAQNDMAAPAWAKIVRTDNTFTGYTSSNGKEWTQVGKPVSIDMPAKIHAGLAVTAGNRDGSRNHTATFTGVTSTFSNGNGSAANATRQTY